MEAYDINPSDVDVEAPPKLFPNAGKASLVATRENTTEDRLASKVFSKHLVDVRGAKSTQYSPQLWLNRFDTFRQEVLRVE